MYFSFTHSTEVCQLPFELTDPEAGIDASALRAHAYSRLRVRLLRLVLRLASVLTMGGWGSVALKAASWLMAVVRLRALISQSTFTLGSSV